MSSLRFSDGELDLRYASLGHYLLLLSKMLIILLVAAVLFVIMLILFGVIGPGSTKRRMRRLTRWFSYDAQLFLPIDPYKPISKAVQEGVENFMPTKKRFQNWWHVELGVLLLFLGISLLLIVWDIVAGVR